MRVPFYFTITDDYIDDVVMLVLDTGDWLKKAAIHTLFRPVDDRNPLPRDDPVSRRKLKEKGTPSEVNTVLEWSISSRSFRIHFLMKKFSA